MEEVLGALVVALVAIIAGVGVLRAAGRRPSRRTRATPRVRAGLMSVFAVLSALVVLPGLIPTFRKGIFAFCGVCPIGAVAAGGPESFGELAHNFFLATWYYTATVLPVFVLACVASGLLVAKPGRFRIRGLLQSFGLAAVLPVCSCGVVPIAKAMIDRGGSESRDGLVFLATAPLLSPVIVSVSLTLLGWRYLVLRVVASFILALSVAIVVSPAIAGRDGSRPRSGSESAPVVTGGGADGSVMLAAWGMLSGLVRYVMFGVVLGSLFAAAVPPDYVGAILEKGVLSMATVVVVGVPINMCAGEEVLLSAPLAGMGLTMGHAIAFALASTGICLSSIPLLVKVLGRRGTIMMVGVYLVVPFLLGMILNALPFLGTLGT